MDTQMNQTKGKMAKDQKTFSPSIENKVNNVADQLLSEDSLALLKRGVEFTKENWKIILPVVAVAGLGATAFLLFSGKKVVEKVVPDITQH